MLVLTRKANQSIMIGDDIEVSVLSILGEKVRLGIQAPRRVRVFRKEVFLDAGPRALAAIGSGVGATVVIVGALWSAVRLLRARRDPGRGRLAAANGLVALGTLVLSSGGLVQGFVGHDEAFALSLAVGIGVIYAGFLVADGVRVRVRPHAPAPSTEYHPA